MSAKPFEAYRGERGNAGNVLDGTISKADEEDEKKKCVKSFLNYEILHFSKMKQL